MTVDAIPERKTPNQALRILIIGGRCSSESHMILFLTKLVSVGLKYTFTQGLYHGLSHKKDKSLDIVLVDISEGSGIDIRDLSILVDNYAHCSVMAIDTQFNERTAKNVRNHGADDYFIHTLASEDEVYQKLTSKLSDQHTPTVRGDVTRHDDLTGLANEAMLCHTLDTALDHVDMEQASIALLSLSIYEKPHADKPETVSLALIPAIARRLNANLRETDMVARRNSGSFSILLRHLNAESDVSIVAEKLIEVLQAPFEISGQIFKVSSNIGIALPTIRHKQGLDLVNDADEALTSAEELGLDQFSFHTLQVKHAEALNLRSRLQTALHHNQFRLVYQPQVDISNGKVIAFEALLRWQLEPNRLLSPAQFMHHIEQSRHSAKVAQWVIDQSCHQIADWHSNGLNELLISINLSHKQFMDPTLVVTIENALLKYAVKAENLRLEVNELTLRHDTAQSKTIVEQLRQLGVQLALDNFGAGMGSLHTLSNFPIDQVKIDSSLIHSALEKPASHAIIDSMITICHQLGINITAEAVETPDQLDYLKQNHCDSYQGFLFSEPLSATAVPPLLLSA